MAFATRVFCRGEPGPSLSDLLVWLHQRERPAMVVGGASRDDLLSPWWTEVALAYDPDEAPFTVRCLRGGAAGAAEMRDALRDFLDDVAELPESEGRSRVEEHLAGTRFVVVIEFPPQGVAPRGYETNGWLMSLFVEQADGMVQCDGVGFYDEDDEIILRLG